jgi:dCTP deaminase
LTLDPLIRVPVHDVRPLDVRKIEPGYTREVTIGEDGYRISSGSFILATSVERITLPGYLAARVEGKSSLGRIGLAVHITAGFFDPGFDGQATLEIANMLNRTIILRATMRIAQIAFQVMSQEPYELYGVKGHYQNQKGPTESRYAMPEEPE